MKAKFETFNTGFIEALIQEQKKTKNSLSQIFCVGERITGINRGNLRGYYYGHAIPTLPGAFKISSWLNEPIESLFGGQNSGEQ